MGSADSIKALKKHDLLNFGARLRVLLSPLFDEDYRKLWLRSHGISTV
jgi:hypothetical protein